MRRFVPAPNVACIGAGPLELRRRRAPQPLDAGAHPLQTHPQLLGDLLAGVPGRRQDSNTESQQNLPLRVSPELPLDLPQGGR